jgi:hypothetical protein
VRRKPQAFAAERECVTFQTRLLPLLEISPVLGRNFLPEDAPHGPPVVMISYALWQGITAATAASSAPPVTAKILPTPQ